MSRSPENYIDYRARLASEIKSQYPWRRKEALAIALEDPQYYIAKYSKREGRQLTLEETFSILNPQYSRMLEEDSKQPNSEFEEFTVSSNEDIGSTPEFEEFVLNSNDSVNYFYSLISTCDKMLASKDPKEIKLIESDLIKQLPRINELHQTYLSHILSLRNMYFFAKARSVVAKEFLSTLTYEYAELADKCVDLDEKGEEPSDSDLIRIDDIYRKIFNNGGVHYIADRNERLMADIGDILKLYKANSVKVISLIEYLKKIDPQASAVSGESIKHRVEFETIPPGYISLFHSTQSYCIESIDKYGLLTSREDRIRNSDESTKKQPDTSNNIYPNYQLYLDRFRDAINPRYKNDAENISRANCIYAFLNFNDFEDNLFLEPNTKGKVMLEILVDPKNCYVIDFEESTRVLDYAWRVDSNAIGATRITGDDFYDYWTNLVSLEDYLKYYEDGRLVEGAPEGLPHFINSPEVLLTKDIPQSYIRIVDRSKYIFMVK